MKVVIDDREKDKERINAVIDYYGKDKTTIERLSTGDIVIHQDGGRSSVAFEIKTWQDFIGSIKNRRIQHEVLNMKNDYPFCFVIIYDNKKWNRKYVQASRAQIQGNIISIMQRYKVPVIIAKNLKELIICLDICVNNVNKALEPIDPPIVRSKDTNEMINVLIGLPKVGKKTAQKLLSEFDKPSNVFNASKEELDNVKGLSAITKRAILRM